MLQNMKKVEAVLASPEMHWVGDGFPVSSVISPQTVRSRVSPFVLMDYAGPAKFAPADERRGVDTHPHRGFETVTVVYQGELEHRDSAGNHGSIGPGDVQWMTAASGVLHEEKHSEAFTRRGGMFEAAQLWVNLPAKDKMSKPSYQDLRKAEIPEVALAGGRARLISGDFGETKGAARTHTPVIVWDVKLEKGAEIVLPVKEGWSLAIYVRSGKIRVGGTHDAAAKELAVLEREGTDVGVVAQEASELLVVGGEPIREPVVAYGPFVMNKPEEIEQAIRDVQAGKFGKLE